MLWKGNVNRYVVVRVLKSTYNLSIESKLTEIPNHFHPCNCQNSTSSL